MRVKSKRPQQKASEETSLINSPQGQRENRKKYQKPSKTKKILRTNQSLASFSLLKYPETKKTLLERSC